jgi:hypothetical protein
MQRYSSSSNPTDKAVSTSSVTRIPTAPDSSRIRGSPFGPDTGTAAGVVRRRGAAVLGTVARYPRCRQAPATTTVVAGALPAADRAMADDCQGRPPVVRQKVRQVVRQKARPVARHVRPEARPVVRHVRPEVRHDCPGRYPRVVRSIHRWVPAHPGPHRRPMAVRSAPRPPTEHLTRWGR